MPEVKIQSKRILKAAKGCPEAKRALNTLFPEVFVNEKRFNLYALAPSDLCPFTREQAQRAGFLDERFLQIRSSSNYEGCSFFLKSTYDWQLLKDDAGQLVLLPTR